MSAELKRRVEEEMESDRVDGDSSSKRAKPDVCSTDDASHTTNTSDTNRSICTLNAPKVLNEQQQRLFDYVVGRREFEPIFVSGSAGTGKSALLKALKNHWEQEGKIVWVVSYTNLAARNVEGATVHSTFGFDFSLNFTPKKVGVPNYLIVDEISMVPQKMLDGISERLKQSARIDAPFGGVNTIVFGDLFQLPPVDDFKSKHKAVLPPYHAQVWRSLQLFELTQNMRQSEQQFIDALNMLRLGDRRCQDFFNEKVLHLEPTVEEKVLCTSLVSTHREADSINGECYRYVKRMNPEETEHQVKLTVARDRRSRNCIVFNKSQEGLIFKEGLKYCVGTRVMVTQNVRNGFCNGDMGVIVAVAEDGLYIQREWDGKRMRLCMVELAFETETWRLIKLVTGLPICYGWAVTIHKAQGMTLRNLIVHPERTFVEGQAYVALSRVTHCDGLKLVNAIPNRSIMDMRDIKKVYQTQTRLVFEDGDEEVMKSQNVM